MKAIQTRSYAGLIGVVILLAVLNILSAQLLRNVRLDLTEEKLFTLSDASVSLVKEIEDPIKIKYFFSSTDGANISAFKTYGEQVLDLLNSYTRYSKLLQLEVYDPRPDSEESEWAEKYGLTPVQIMTGDVLFCGLVVLNEMGDEEVIPFFDSKREEFLEYDLSKAVSAVSNTQKIVLGVFSPLPLEGNSMPYRNPGGDSESDPWYFTHELKQMYEVRPISSLETIDDDINLLLVIHPKELSQKAEYALDQYILSGKSAMILVDPYCESEQINPNPENPMMAMSARRNSDLPLILKKAGFKLPEGKMILERDRATQVQTAPGQIADYYAWASFTSNEINKQDAVTGQLETLLLPTSGFFEWNQDQTDFSVSTLLKTSPTASVIDTSLMMFGGTPKKLADSFVPGDKELPIAVRVTGNLKTAFPDGAPDEEKKETAQDDNREATESIHLTESKSKANLILVANVDFIANRFSLNVANFFGNVLLTPLNDNLNLFFNALESLSGSSSLIGIRSRGKFSRPFTKVQEIEKEAQAEWKEEENRLTQKVEEVNAKIESLMKQEEGKTIVSNKAILDEVEKFREEKKETQRKLREVRKNLRQDKEKLGTRLFLLNTIFIPGCILLYGLFRMLTKN